jgi:hypothetical protein
MYFSKVYLLAYKQIHVKTIKVQITETFIELLINIAMVSVDMLEVFSQRIQRCDRCQFC